jgi:AcrR family transcriptional regulator
MSIDPTSLRADAQRNYDRLLHTASSLFSVQGPLASMEKIAKQAGVGIGTLYRHFPTRTALLEAVYADKITDLTTKAQALLSAPVSDEALFSWLQSTVDYSLKYSGFSDMFSLLVEDQDSALIVAGSALLLRAQKAGTLRDDVTIMDLLQLVKGVVVDGSSSRDAARTTKLLSVVEAGLKPVASHAA